MAIRVFERGAGKWVIINHDNVQYTSSVNDATAFSLSDLIMVNQAYEDFSIYRRTLHAVADGTNHVPHECPTVQKYIADEINNAKPFGAPGMAEK